jgi:putative ABC transport system permease protein
MALPLTYNLKSAFVRKGATVLTLTAISFSVAVLVLVLALAYGFEAALAGTGSDDNAIFLRGGATSEGVSGMTRRTARILQAGHFVAKDGQSRPLSQTEIYAAFNLERAGGGRANIPVRGTGPTGLLIRENAKIRAGGRMFVPGRYELVVGTAVVDRLAGCYVGGAIELAGYRWKIVGVLDSGGEAYDSELWVDVEIFLRVLDRGGFSTIIARLARPDRLADLAQRLEDDPRLDVTVKTERQYFSEQAGALSIVLKVLAWFLAAIMGTGAVFGATNTLLASVSMRTSLALAVVGGAIGVLLGAQCNGLATGTTNWATFTEQSFAFRVSPEVIAQAMILAVVIGILGGALPARRAAKLTPRAALRAG